MLKINGDPSYICYSGPAAGEEGRPAEAHRDRHRLQPRHRRPPARGEWEFLTVSYASDKKVIMT